MFAAHGLYGHIQKHLLKSALLLAGFTVLIALTWFAWCVIYTALLDGWWQSHRGMHRMSEALTVAQIFSEATALALHRWWLPLLFTVSWFVVAYLVHADMIRAASGSRPVSRVDAPKLYNLVENLAITAGLPMPRIEVITTPARNAFASGLGPNDACITVTTGLVRSLTDDELEAVLAHELTHIKNYDVRLMVIATVFTGGLTLIGDGVARMLFPPKLDPMNFDYGYGDQIIDDNRRADMGARVARGVLAGEGDSMPAAVIMSLLLGVIFLATAHIMSLATKFAISRSREFLADAGAVELTKNPDALISALRKIAGHDDIPGLNSNLQAMMISGHVDSLFSTHPPVENRIMALQQYAGGRPTPRVTRNAAPQSAPAMQTNLTGGPPVSAMGFNGGRATFGRRGAAGA